MRTDWATYPIQVSGGLVKNLPPLQQGLNLPGSAVILQNFEVSPSGGYKRVLGYERWGDSTGFFNPIHCVAAINARDVLIGTGLFYLTSENEGPWVNRLTLPGATPTPTRTRHVTFDFNGTPKIALVNGVTKPIIYNTVAKTCVVDSAAPTDVEGASYVAQFRNHLFFAKNDILTFTAPYLETSYSAGAGAGSIRVGSAITGLVVFRRQLVIFSEDQINILTGNTSSDFQLQPLTLKTGCINGDTIQEVGGDILYLGPDGVRFLSSTDLNEDFALQRASESIQAEITGLLSEAGTFSSCVIRSKAQYRLFRWLDAVPTSLSKGFIATRFADQSATNIGWSTTLGIKPRVIDSKQFGENEVIFFSGDEEADSLFYLYKMEEGDTFNGEPIRFQFRTPDMAVTDPRRRKTFFRGVFYLKAEGTAKLRVTTILDSGKYGTLQPSPKEIDIQYDPSTLIFGAGVFGVSVFNPGTDALFPLNLQGSSFTVAFDISGSEVSAPFAIDTILLEFRENDKK